MIEARSLHPTFVAEITGVNFGDPLDGGGRDAIEAAMDEHAICIFRNDTPLADDLHVAFSRTFGPPVRQRMQQTVSGKGIRLGTDELIDVGNLDEQGNIYAADDPRRAFGNGNRLWHTDVSFDAERGSYSMLSAHVVPPQGGDTEFADMRAAYEALPQAMKERLDGLVAEHSVWYSRVLGGMEEASDAVKATRPPAHHPLVFVNPRTGRRSLYLASHASHIVGRPETEGRALLDELREHATQTEFIYRHVWRAGDLVMWDNRQTMHRGTPFDDTVYPRDMRRVTVREAAGGPA